MLRGAHAHTLCLFAMSETKTKSRKSI